MKLARTFLVSFPTVQQGYNGDVFPFDGTFFVILFSLIAMAAGMFTGTLACLCLRLQIRGLMKDALLGWLGFFLGFIACILISPHNSLTTNVGPNPYFFAFLGAAFLPILREVYRFGRT